MIISGIPVVASNFKGLITFVPNAPFLYPMKTPETVNFSNIFKGQKKGALGPNRLNVTKDL